MFTLVLRALVRHTLNTHCCCCILPLMQALGVMCRWIKLWDSRVFSTAAQRSAAARAVAAEAAAAAVAASSKQKRLRMGGMDLDFPGGGADSDDDGDVRGSGWRQKRDGNARGFKGGGKAGASAAPSDAEPEHVRVLREKFGFGWKVDARILLFSGPPGMVRRRLCFGCFAKASRIRSASGFVAHFSSLVVSGKDNASPYSS
jgi:hypothetical protein